MLISIYPRSGGTHREMRAESDMAASGPFDSPQTIVGRLIAVPTEEEFREIHAGEVLFEGEVYTFHALRNDGSFELEKAW
jgi:hypothetical protein